MSSVRSDRESRELRSLVERIKRGDCVLVLGPRAAIRPDDPEHRPLDDVLAGDLVASLDPPASEQQVSSLRAAADLYYRVRQDREELELAVRDFYAEHGDATTEFHRDLARLPFRLCVSASPDNLMFRAFEAAGKAPQRGHYNFSKLTQPRLAEPTAERPLVYHLFGHYEDPKSLVLTEGDLIEFLVAVVRGTPAVPDQVRSLLADQSGSFLFLGFGFHNWYLRVLLQVLNVYGHRSKPIAFEDTPFFTHPDRQQVAGFFSGDRLIEFRPLRWEEFARQLRETYGPEDDGGGATPQPAPAIDAGAPKAFLSYASEDRDAVEGLAVQLRARGVDVWQDQQELRAGDKWDRVLIDVIEKRVDYVVVVQTPAMNARIEGVFHREIEAAMKRHANMGGQFRFLLPVTMKGGELLPSLNDWHAVAIDTAAGVDALAKSIREDWQRRIERRARAQAVA